MPYRTKISAGATRTAKCISCSRVQKSISRKKKGEIARDYEEGVYRVCHKLIELGCAESWAAAAGSMFVLRKLRDLPEDFAARFEGRLMP